MILGRGAEEIELLVDVQIISSAQLQFSIHFDSLPIAQIEQHMGLTQPMYSY